ncbi:MAG: T9SS type A sorting domain-containing protein [Chitinophagales bacterium]
MKKIVTLFLASFSMFSAFASIDISLTDVTVKKSSVINRVIPFSITVENIGTETVSMLEVQWNLPSLNTSIIRDLNILPGETFTINNLGEFTLKEARKYEFTVSVISVNGKTDALLSNNVFTQNVHGTSREAVKKAVAEEATGTWCGFCPRGAVYMDLAKEEFGDQFIGIAVHNSDPMENNVYDAAIGSYPGFSGYPSAILDRKLLIDPSALLTQIPNRLDNDPIAEINVYGEYDAVNRLLHVTAVATFLSDEDELEYRFNVVLTEDGVTGTTSGYNQTNYYSGGGYGPLYGWEDLPYTVPAADMVYEFVAREIVDGWDGSEESVPAVVTAGQVVSYEYHEIEIDEDWDENNINVIVLLTDFDDPKNEIINANSAKLTTLIEYVGIQDVSSVNDVDIFPNPADEQTFIRVDLNETTEVIMQITDMNGKVVLNNNYGILSGDNAINVNTTTLSTGIYIVNIQAGNQMKTEKLHVTH